MHAQARMHAGRAARTFSPASVLETCQPHMLAHMPTHMPTYLPTAMPKHAPIYILTDMPAHIPKPMPARNACTHVWHISQCPSLYTPLHTSLYICAHMPTHISQVLPCPAVFRYRIYSHGLYSYGRYPAVFRYRGLYSYRWPSIVMALHSYGPM